MWQQSGLCDEVRSSTCTNYFDITLSAWYSSSGLLGIGSVTGEAGENNCYACNGGALVNTILGECGNSTVQTIAIYALTGII